MRLRSGHVPLAHSVRRLAAGARPVIRFDQVRSIAIGLPALPQDTDEEAHRLLRNRRLHSGIAAVVVVLVVVGAVILIRKVDQPPPPTTRDITLPYLAGTSWDPDTEAFYDDTDTTRDVVVGMLQDGGVAGTPTVGPIWSLVVSSKEQPTGAEADDIDADVDVVGIGAVPASKAVAGGVALEKEVADAGAPAPATVTGLPSGWAGELTNGEKGGIQRSANVFGSAGGTLVWISVEGDVDDATLSHRAAELATAVAQRSIPRFVTDTAR